jgi:hypothetical protein
MKFGGESETTFHLTQCYLDLLQAMHTQWFDVDYGAPAVVDKRQFCVSDPVYDEDEKQWATPVKFEWYTYTMKYETVVV